MRFARFFVPALICCMAIQQVFPLLAAGQDRTSDSISIRRQVPIENVVSQKTAETVEAECEQVETDDLRGSSSPPHAPLACGTVVVATNCWGFDTGRQLLDALHRLRL